MSHADHPYADFVHRVEKPARYLGGEFNAVVKDWSTVRSRFALCFPDIYDIGMSHLGTKILYSVLNQDPDLLMERAFCPWLDMEEELRKRELPLLSLETHRPLCDFDVVGFSLQYEMTFTNILTMLDLGRVPLRSEDRTLDDPLVIAGGPCATHPEVLAPFIDVFLIGDAEERLPQLLLHYATLREEGGHSREEILVALAREGGLYCPALYDRERCERSGLVTVTGSRHEGVPRTVERAFLDDISRFRFPDDSPVAVAEAIFDRMSVEIARGCTEGCRFCQAGMIYRPVRERHPDEIVETLVSAIEKGGYDEASITSLSTADYSCVSPLIKRVMEELRPRKVSLGISSLRAYGLDDDLLDEIASVKATGLTFAPEAGTQRMRDVVNKNISEEDIFATCHRVFSKGWQRMKLYFMIGLPTETDEDVVGIAEMGRQAFEIGQEYHRRRVKVTVSVSSHVPKPHTPFQWAAMDSMEEIERKQKILIELGRRWGYLFRRHDMKVSHLEGILTRGDIRTADLLEDAWRRGARFDGWDEKLRWDAWQEALDAWEAKHDVRRDDFLATLPVDGRLPWDHVDVGLEDGFLLKEYRKSLANRLSPPCGKPAGAKVHHTNLVDAQEDERRLVCYHCGVACDLTQMREERVDYLERLGATERPVPRDEANAREQAIDRLSRGLAPHDFAQGDAHRFRLAYTRLGATRLQGHLDMVRELPRLFRRAGLALRYSEGYSPSPIFAFTPALPLGALSYTEFLDVTLNEDPDPQDLLQRMNEAAPEGLHVTAVRKVLDSKDTIAARITAVDHFVGLDDEALRIALDASDTADAARRLAERLAWVEAQETLRVTVIRKRREREIDLREVLLSVRLGRAQEFADPRDIRPDRLGLHFRQHLGQTASLKPVEVVEAIVGSRDPVREILRMAFVDLSRGPFAVKPMEAGSGEGAFVMGPMAQIPLAEERTRRRRQTALAEVDARAISAGSSVYSSPAR